MPIYEYRCEECGRSFEMLRRFQDSDKEVKCPLCESANVERQLSCFSTGGGGCGTGGARRGGFS